MTQPSAKIIADSINDWGQRLTTMEVVMHRFVLAEFNTHRVFSRNSASSRAIPVTKVMDRVAKDPCRPVVWPKEQSGMQGGLPFNEDGIRACETDWDYARFDALRNANELKEIGLHKSLTNRLLEPFMWHTVIVTATDWDNFFWQRCHPDAQPEIKAAADEMQRAFFRSTPEHLTHGQWHLPYITKQDREEVNKMELFGSDVDTSWCAITETLKKISTARCARVSYLTHDGKRDLMEDVGLFNRLSESGHWSPFEHVATPVSFGSQFPLSNFRGWKQFRKEFPQENRAAFLPNLDDLADVRMRMEAGLVPWKGGSDA